MVILLLVRVLGPATGAHLNLTTFDCTTHFYDGNLVAYADAVS